MCRAVAHKILEHEQDAEDAASETVLRALTLAQSAPTDPDALANWMAVIARHAAIDMVRRRISQRRHFPRSKQQATDRHRTDATEAHEIGRRCRLHDALARLLPKHRAALEALYLDGRSQQQVAAEMGMNGSAFRQLLFRARRKFREAYGKG